ncbi:MAG: N-acetyl-alpha-D-glucosaminyl L-malate synthase BshA [Actinomycetota bacterium]|nr:N-acetyl-alpha-D-glucosaminyl L-malate synthase BshA [Actinomycetota bacterium]
MKIGITCYPTYGGSGVIASELGIELAERGHQVHFISYEMPFKINKYYENIYFHEVEVLEYPLFKYPPYSLSLSVKMAEIFEHEGLDIMHVHYAIPHAASAYLTQNILGKNSSFKFITTLHGTDITIVGNHSSFFKLTKFCIENSNGITSVSDYLKKLTIETFDISKEIEVIYNFVDTSKYKRNNCDKNKIGLVKKNESAIIHVSNFRPVKKIKNIIEVFYKVRKEIDCKLILVGEGPEAAFAKETVKQLGLSSKVFFLGRKDNVAPLLNCADLYLLPSKSESFGVSALEALSCGVPVIGTNVGGLKEVVADGVCGYLFDPDDIDSMAKASIDILSNKSLFEKLSAGARETALKFDSNVIIPKYIDYYKKIMRDN